MFSLTAIFVALAVGVAAGAAAVGGRLGDQESVVRALEREFDRLEGQLRQAAAREREVVARAQSYEAALARMAPALVRPRLEGQPVQVRPWGRSDRATAALVRLLQEAGARVQVSSAAAQTGPAAVVLQAEGRLVVGLVGPPDESEVLPVPAGVTAILQTVASGPVGLEASNQAVVDDGTWAVSAQGPVAWGWQAEGAGGRATLLVALACRAVGPVDARWAAERLAAMAEGGSLASRGERRRACP